MLGESVADPQGIAGDAGEEPGLGLLPARTGFSTTKIVRQVTAECDGREWTAYEIHMGRTEFRTAVPSLHTVREQGVSRPEGARHGNVWGTYLHGWFEAPEVRRRVAAAAGLESYRAHPVPWMEQRQVIYTGMAAHLAAHVDLGPVRRYLGL